MHGQNFHQKKDKLYESKHNDIYDQTERQKKERVMQKNHRRKL